MLSFQLFLQKLVTPMSAIRFENVSKKYNNEEVISNINLTIPEGKFFALLGPSGCGKTTILRLIGGFEHLDSGRIYLDDIDVTDMPINKRRVNTVFQNYALFPHLNVFENVAYGLVIKRVPPAEIKPRVLTILEKVHLDKHAFKAIDQLSGGQQQRVAIARAIVNEPKVLLLDEPLAALDRHLKERMLVELIDLQYELKTTFVYVTHDPSEALAVSDKMAIMNDDGVIAQVGDSKEIYEFPHSSFVARFIGQTNIFTGTLQCLNPNECTIATPAGTFLVSVEPAKSWAQSGKTVMLSVRPEKIEISAHAQEGFSNHAQGTIDAMIYHGRSTEYLVNVNGKRVNVFEQNEEHFVRDSMNEGDRVNLYWQKENAILLET